MAEENTEQLVVDIKEPEVGPEPSIENVSVEEKQEELNEVPIEVAPIDQPQPEIAENSNVDSAPESENAPPQSEAASSPETPAVEMAVLSENEPTEVIVVVEAPQTGQLESEPEHVLLIVSEPSQSEPESVVVIISEEPEESPAEKAEKVLKEQERLDAMTSYIETVEAISLKDEAHPQLERPGVKPTARRKRTNKQKTFAELEEEERQRQEDARKPKQQVDQVFTDPLGLLEKPQQRSASIAQEAQNVHAAFLQKAKERKAKEEAEQKSRQQAILEEERAARSSGRISVGRRGKREAASAGAKIQVDLEESPGEVKGGFMAKLQAQGCCVIS